ncbi:TRAP-type C4-dicarboxylate transport system permease small subunit [Altererythrobacter atlanticus]|uniref:TRAP transporter small permease protein n=1 Tax=Croceibacterium atlanticum TaxID=1267766 RepID=A0A0F7KQY0_9SPHN|nr:TRAP transporter small permease [Croceibacterium atlanticum]AKH41506.1 2,3-diketo-L-gulonate TRAP transporter small permease protein YiaM [Croceibacterium atlanticum]MBB5732968.1 TRAP-type C4-dicarboxylate transport system permease small subunit [Croceibacterium atlanticum]
MNRATKLAVWVGGIALLFATAIDTAAVIGRHIGVPLTGSIELMQAAVLVSGSIGIIVATAAQAHARVHLLVERLGGPLRQMADRLSDTITLLFCASLLAGSVWLSIDLWDAHETSEILGVPWRVLRLFANGALLVVCLTLAGRIFRKGRS